MEKRLLKGLKVSGIICAVLAGLLALAAVAAKLIVTPERVRNALIPLAEKKLHRSVRMGDVQVNIFSGIQVKGLTIAEKDGGESFVTAELIRLKYQFWPLLSRRVVIDEVRLDAPHIRIVRMRDGSFNYSDILAKQEPSREPKKEGEEVNLLVTRVGLKRGELLFEDRMVASGQPAVYRIGGVEFTASDIAPDQAFPFKAGAVVAGATITLDGKAWNLISKPALDTVMQIRADLKTVTAALPAAMAAKAKTFDPSGSVTARIHLSGLAASPKESLKEGELHIENAAFTAGGQRPALAGKLVLNGAALSSENLALSLGSDKLQINLSIANIFAKPITVASGLKADSFDLTPFLGGSGAARPSGPTATKPEPGPLNLPVRATGTVQIGQTRYKGLPITNILVKYRLVDNVLTIDQLTGNLSGGSFSDTCRVDLSKKGFTYSARLTVKGVQANQLAAAFAPKAANSVYGTLSLNGDIAGAGTASEAIKKNLSGSGDFRLTEGRLTGSGLILELSRFLNLEQLRTIRFDTFAGTFRVQNGKVMLDSGMSGKDVQITPKGTAGLDKSLDISMITRISPDLTSRIGRGDIGRFMTDDKGWGMIPLRIAGTMAEPKFRLDTARAGEQLKSKAREKLQETIERKFLKQKEGEQRRPEQELIEKGLKGIFGR